MYQPSGAALALPALIFLSAAFSAAAARELWVDRDSLGGECSDARARADVAATTPWCTLGASGDRVTAGDTVTVRGGVYAEPHLCPGCNDTAVLQITGAGRADAPIRYRVQPGERAVVSGRNGVPNGVLIVRTSDGKQPRHIELSGFEVENFTANCVLMNQIHDVTIKNFDIHGCNGSSVEVQRTERVTIENSRIYDNALSSFTSAVDLLECGAGNVVRGNFIWNNTDEHPLELEGHGILMDNCPAGATVLIENNVLWDNEGWCIVAFESEGGTIRHNTCYRNANGRPDSGEISLLGARQSVYNNILLPRAGQIALLLRERDDYPVDLSTSRADGNLIWAPDNANAVGWSQGQFATAADYPATNPYGWGANLVIAEPGFTDADAGDFSLAAGSPAIDAALAGQSPAVDVLGRTRPAGPRSDIGAYERGATEPRPDRLFDSDFETTGGAAR